CFFFQAEDGIRDFHVTGVRRVLFRSLSQTETSTNLRIKVLNVSKKELLRDLQRAPEFDQSAVFKKVYEEEFGVFGGSPFGALIEIGRASCRERVEIARVSAALNKKNT